MELYKKTNHTQFKDNADKSRPFAPPLGGGPRFWRLTRKNSGWGFGSSVYKIIIATPPHIFRA